MKKHTKTFCKQATIKAIAQPVMQAIKKRTTINKHQNTKPRNIRTSTLTLHVGCTNTWSSRVPDCMNN